MGQYLLGVMCWCCFYWVEDGREERTVALKESIASNRAPQQYRGGLACRVRDVQWNSHGPTGVFGHIGEDNVDFDRAINLNI